MERVKDKALKKFPEQEKVAMVIGSLYEVALTHFKERGNFPRVVVYDHYSDGKISCIAFENLPPDETRELYQKIIARRPHAWGHVEAIADDENVGKSWLKLYADLAYP